MAGISGPNLVDDGLVLALDAADINSFDEYENLWTYSEQFNDASWGKNNYTVTANATTAPDGTLTADKLIAINSNTYHDLYKTLLLSSNTYTLSIFAKAAEQSFIQLRIDDNAISRIAIFNLTNGSVNASTDLISSSITPYPNGWYRCSITVATNIVNAVFNGFPTSSNEYYSGDGVSGLYIWGAQLEKANAPTDYYATTGTTKTRGSTWIDLSSNGNTGTLTNGPTYSTANGGSIVFDGTNDYITVSSISVSTFTYEGWVYNTSSNSVNYYGYFFSGGDFGLAISEGGNIGGLVSGDFYYYNGSSPISLGYNLSPNQWTQVVSVIDGVGKTLKLFINGIERSTSNVINTQTTITDFGRYSGNLHFWNGRVSNIKLYNRALTEAEVQQNFNETRSRFGI